MEWRWTMPTVGGEFATNCDDRDDNDKTIYFTPSSHFFMPVLHTLRRNWVVRWYLRLLSFVLYRSRFFVKEQEGKGAPFGC